MKTSQTLKYIFASTLTTATPVLFATTKTKASHVHGLAKLSLAIENNAKAILLLEAPGESFFGFEHEAKNSNDKKVKQEVLSTLEKEANDLFLFDKAAHCIVSKNKVEIHHEEHEEDKSDKKHKHSEEKHGEHNEVEAEYSVNCAKKPSTLEVKLGIKFPKIKNLQIQILKDEAQNSFDIKEAKGIISL